MSVEPPSHTGKIQHRLKILAFKTCSNCIGRSWNSSTERPERRLHCCCEPPCLQQSNLGVPVCMKSSLTCLEKTRHARFLRYVYAPVESTEISTPCQKLTSILIFLVGYSLSIGVRWYEAVRCNIRRAIFQQFQTRVISTFCSLNTLIGSIPRRTDMIIKCNGQR